METKRTKKALINISFNLINQILTLLLSFLSRTVFIRTLGAEYLGISGLFNDVLNLLSMADLGFGTAMIYSFYKPLANKDHRKMAGLITFYKKIYRMIAGLVTIIGILLVPFLPYLVNLENDLPNLELYYLFSLSNVVVSYLCVYRTSVLAADQKGYLITKITMIFNIGKTVLQIISLIVWKNYLLYLVIGTIISLLNNMAASYYATKMYPFIQRPVVLDKSEKRNIFDNLGSVFLYKVSSVLLNATDNILISVLVGTVAVGYYSNYLMIQNRIVALYSLVFTSMTASIGNLIVTEKAEKRYEIFQCEQSVGFLFCGVVVPCFVILVDDFIGIWLGAEFVFPFAVTCAIGLNMYLGCVLQPLWSYREATGLYKKTKWVMVCCAVLNLIFSVLFGKLAGTVGIIFSSGLARIMTYVWFEPKLLFQDYFEMSSKKYYIQILWNAFCTFFLVVVFKYLWKFWQIESFFQWLFKAVITGSISILVFVLLYYNSEGIRIIKLKLQAELKKKY